MVTRLPDKDCCGWDVKSQLYCGMGLNVLSLRSSLDSWGINIVIVQLEDEGRSSRIHGNRSIL